MQSAYTIKDRSENHPLLKVAAFRKNVRKTEPHKHNSYIELVYLGQGSGHHTIDNHRYEVRPPVVFVIRSEQVHFWDLDEMAEPGGYVLILKKLLFEESTDWELKSLLPRIAKLTCVYLNEDSSIAQLLELLTSEYALSWQAPFSFAESLIKALFIKILVLADQGRGQWKPQRDLYLAFADLIASDRPGKNTIFHYANLLNTTPQNLNAACRKAVNQPASMVLADFLLDEAKRLLVYTSKTIREISFMLSFKDTSHFVKYFKRYTALTPRSYRATHRL